MAGDSLQAARQQQKTRMLEEENRLMEEARKFVAKPLPGSTYAPSFVAQPSERPPLMCVDNVLASELRAKERRSFDEAQKKRIEEQARQREELVQQRENEAEAEYQQRMDTPIEEGGLR